MNLKETISQQHYFSLDITVTTIVLIYNGKSCRVVKSPVKILFDLTFGYFFYHFIVSLLTD